MSRAVIRTMTEEEPDREALEEAAGILREGGLVAFPTETVYGLGGNALDPEASRKIYEAKGRPSDNPLIVHIADRESLTRIVTEIPEAARRLADACWPGPLTMILPRSSLVPLETTGGLDTVAVRLPGNRIARELIRLAGGYVAAPSANTSGRPSPTLASHVEEDLGDRIDMILDGGPVDIGLESTIVDFTEGLPLVLRPGYLDLDRLRSVLGEVRLDPGLDEDRQVRPKAPGMRYRHYAPRAALTIVEGGPDETAEAIRRLAEKAARQGKRVGIICTEESREAYPLGEVRSIGSRLDEDTIARHLYEVLREFDHGQVDEIYSEAFYTPRMGEAIMNRLIKAAGHRLVRASDIDGQELSQRREKNFDDSTGM